MPRRALEYLVKLGEGQHVEMRTQRPGQRREFIDRMMIDLDMRILDPAYDAVKHEHHGPSERPQQARRRPACNRPKQLRAAQHLAGNPSSMNQIASAMVTAAFAKILFLLRGFEHAFVAIRVDRSMLNVARDRFRESSRELATNAVRIEEVN